MAMNVFQRKGRPGWYIRVRNQGRLIVRGSFSTQHAAQIALGDLRREIERGELGITTKTKMTLKEFTDKRFLSWAKVHKRTWENDQRSLKGKILPKLGHLALPDLTLERVEKYLTARLKEIKPSSANREAALLRKMLNLAVQWNLLEDNPLTKLDMFPESPSRNPTITSDDEAKLLAACQPWLRRLVEAALLTGARQGELLALCWKHIDFEGQQIIIADSKTGQPRLVPLHPHLESRFKGREGQPDERVFTLSNGKPIHQHTCSQAYRRKRKKLGLDVKFHDLRHIAITRMLAGRAGAMQVSTVVGHKSLLVTRRYSHLTVPDLRDAVGVLSVQQPGEPEIHGEHALEHEEE